MGFWKRLGAFLGWGSSDGPASTPNATSRTESAPSAPKDPQRQAFAELFLAEAAKVATVRRIEQDAQDPFCLRVWTRDDREPSLAYLNGIFQETRELSPERRLAQLHRFMRVFSQPDQDPDWDDLDGRLLPVLRTVGFASESKHVLISRPFLPFVHVFVVIDHQDSVAFVGQKQLDGWQKPASEVFESAMTTLTNYVSAADVEPYDTDASSALLHVAVHDDYEPSRLAAPGFLASFAGKVAGNPIAIIPDRARMLIGGDSDPQLVARLARSAEAEYRASARGISPAVYTVGADGSVEPLHLASDHPAYLLVERGHRLLAATGYDRQKERLEAEFKRDDIDIFVASLRLIEENGSGALKSWATLAEGVDSLLPEADLIAVVGAATDANNRWQAMVPWQMVFDLAPECLVRSAEYDPPRWRTMAWPSAEVITKFRAYAAANRGKQ